MRRVHLLVRETQWMKTMTVAAPKTKSSAAEIWPSLRCGNRHSRLHRHWRSNSRLRISGCARSDRPDVPLRAILKPSIRVRLGLTRSARSKNDRFWCARATCFIKASRVSQRIGSMPHTIVAAGLER